MKRLYNQQNTPPTVQTFHETSLQQHPNHMYRRGAPRLYKTHKKKDEIHISSLYKQTLRVLSKIHILLKF